MEYYYQIIDNETNQVIFDSMDDKATTFTSEDAARNRAIDHMMDAGSDLEIHRIEILPWTNSPVS